MAWGALVTVDEPKYCLLGPVAAIGEDGPVRLVGPERTSRSPR